MAFNIDQVLTDMARSLVSTTAKKGKKTMDQAVSFLEARKYRLERLAQRRIQGTIGEDVFQQALQDEQEVMQAELIAMKIAAKATAQSAVNGAMAVLEKAVKTALGLL